MTPLLRALVRYGYVPFMILGMNAAAYFVVANGHSYVWLLPLLAITLGTAFFAERTLPVHEEWNEPHGDEAATVWHAIVYELSNTVGILMIPLVAFLLHQHPGEQLTSLWPREWPIWAQLMVALVVGDFAFTLIHYLSHRWSTLWRLHAVHHGVTRLYGFNGFVRHPLHQMLDMAIGSAPLALAGMPVPVAALLGFAVSVQLVVQHSNVDYELGPFRNALSVGRIHHLHHVNWGKEGDVNFGLFLTLWDRLLGTFQAEPPRPITANDMGIDDIPDFPKNYSEHLAFPVRYKPGAAAAAAAGHAAQSDDLGSGLRSSS
jgi:sterol desaturase/sphingolipid hydroxylase (fatty acid hydroxylase superfamily)